MGLGDWGTERLKNRDRLTCDDLHQMPIDTAHSPALDLDKAQRMADFWQIPIGCEFYRC